MITHVIDLNLFDPGLNRGDLSLLSFDINDKYAWDIIPNKSFDFVTCTHTLEDVRDPGFVVSQLSRIAKAGLVAVPNRVTELSNVESKYWRGYYHHRWVYLVQDHCLTALPKLLPLFLSENTFSRIVSVLFRMRNKFPGNRFRGLSIEKPIVRAYLKKNRGVNYAPPSELSLVWQESLDFHYFNSDFAGDLTNQNPSDVRFFRKLCEEFLQLRIRDDVGTSPTNYSVVSEIEDRLARFFLI